MQGNRFITTTLAGLFALGFSASAFAIMSAPNGWYLEANAGSTDLSNKSYPGGNSSSSGVGGNANIGYKFMPYFALEGGYTQYANTSITNSATNTKAGTDKHYSYDLSLRGILPIMTSGFELFAKAGIQRLNSKVSINNSAAAAAIGLGSSHHSTTGIYLGAGGQYYFIPELAVVAQWQTAQGNSETGNMSLLSGGLSFVFD